MRASGARSLAAVESCAIGTAVRSFCRRRTDNRSRLRVPSTRSPRRPSATMPALQLVKPLLLRSSSFLLIALGLAHCLRHVGYTIDDAYITFRYARNLVHGLGLVYNAGD